MSVGSRVPYIANVIPNDWNSLLRFSRDVQKYISTLASSDQTLYLSELFLTGSTASRLLATDSSQEVVSTDLFSWVTGTANQITVTDDSDGTITLSGPQDLATTSSPTFDDLTISSPSNIYALSHDSFTDFVANEHINHTSVTLTAGTGLTGGGDISANRTFAVDGVLEDLDTLGAASADGEFIVATGAGVFAYESGNTARTSLGLGTADSPTLAGLTVTNCCVLGSNSAVFQPNTDSITFFKVMDADGGTAVLDVDSTNERVGVGTDAPSLKFDVKGSPNTSFTNCPLLAQFHTTDGYADGMGGGISLGGMYDGTHSTTFGYIAGLKEGAAESDTAGKLVLGARPTGGGAVDMTVITIHGTGITDIGDGGTTNYLSISATGDVTFNGSSGFYPRVLNQSAEPGAGTGATECDAGEAVLWTDTDDSKCYLCYNHGGTVKTVELT